MPALQAFNMKWTIGSDDLVFPYSLSIAVKAIWFTITIVLISLNNTHHCNEEKLLRTFILLLLSIQLISGGIQLTAVILSAKGTIANPSPRRHLKWILYLQTLVFIVELIWECVGVVWAFDPHLDCSSSHTILVITRIVLLWNVTTSILTASYMFLRMGLHRFICKRTTPWKLKHEKLPPSKNIHGRRLSALSDHSLAHHIKRRRWQWLLSSVLCCLTLRESERNVFQEVSLTLAEAFDKFRGYVVSDILAGVMLLEIKQKKERALTKDTSIINNKSSELTNKEAHTNTTAMVHYLKFAMGSYGWVLYVYSKGLRGLLQLVISSLCHCCYPREPHGLQHTTITGDNRLKWNTQAVLRWTDIRQMDLIHANFSRDVYCPSFIVAIDHVERSVVVAIRGTLSVSDALIDLSAQPSLLMTKNGINFYAHQGIKDTTHSLHLKLEGEGILSKIFKIYPSYKLIITGHSLGAGVATLLSMILQPVYPNLHCYAFSPPGGLINQSAISHTKSFITSVILGLDLVPRLSLQNFELFSRDVLYQLQNSEKPKYRIFLSSFIQWLGIYKPSYTNQSTSLSTHKKNKRHTSIRLFITKPQEEEEGRKESEEEEEYYDSFDSFSDDEIYQSCVEKQEEEEGEGDELELEEEIEVIQTEETKPFITIDPITGKRHQLTPKDRPLLYLPGRIIHLKRGPFKKRCYCIDVSGDLTLHWASYNEFSELIIDEDMIYDHMPDTLLKALESLND